MPNDVATSPEEALVAMTHKWMEVEERARDLELLSKQQAQDLQHAAVRQRVDSVEKLGYAAIALFVGFVVGVCFQLAGVP